VKEKISSLVADLMNEVSINNLLTYNKEVAKDVRLSGSPEELRAFEFVNQTLKDFGIPTKLMFSDAYISLPGEAELKVQGMEFPCITHSMAMPI
jgi:hypothetical protein